MSLEDPYDEVRAPAQEPDNSVNHADAGIFLSMPDFRPEIPVSFSRTNRKEVTVVDGFKCPECRTKNEWSAEFCQTCGVSFYVDLESQHVAPCAAAQEPDNSLDDPDTDAFLPAPDFRPGLPMSLRHTEREEATAVDRFRCPDCGKKNVMTAQYCERCGVSFYVHLESPRDAVGAAAPAPDISADYPANTESVPGKIRGQVFDIERGYSRLNFWLERHHAAGGRLSNIPVEMIGRKIEGTIKNGDWIEISGSDTPWDTIRTSEVKNLTTGLTVVAFGNPEVMTLKSLY